MASSMKPMDAQSAAERAVNSIGCGYDLASDLRLSCCKAGQRGSKLIEIDETLTRDLVVPGGAVVPNVPASIKCDKGERTRFRSDVLSFSQMAEHFNQEVSLLGKIPSGVFNIMFGLQGCWQKDASVTKSLAFDGWFITLYTVALAGTRIALSEEVKRDVPSSWDPPALAEFIDKYGTHVVMGVKMGGKDVIHIKQRRSSNLQQAEIQKLLKKLADERFSDDGGEDVKNSPLGSTMFKVGNRSAWDIHTALTSSFRPSVVCHGKNEEVQSICVRRGGVDFGNHKQWLSTVAESPNVTSMSFVPITSLLNGVPGCGFLSHAVNLYLRYKPPIEELAEFLEFQLPRQWAPAYGDLPLGLHRKKDVSPSLRYTYIGPKLYVNTVKVDTGNRPVTGVRLFLEGKKGDHLAIHLQHLSTLPKILHISDDSTCHCNPEPIDRAYFEPIKYRIFSHICTAPVEGNGAFMEDSASIVTKAWFEAKNIGMKKVLFLRLGFSMVASVKLRRSEWDGPSNLSRKSGVFSSIISGRFSAALTQPEEQKKPDINSAIYPDGPPNKAPKLSNIVDTRERVRGPEEPPGYWVVSGAKLCIESGKIAIKAKYSLLTVMPDEDCLRDLSIGA